MTSKENSTYCKVPLVGFSDVLLSFLLGGIPYSARMAFSPKREAERGQIESDVVALDSV